MFLITIVLVSEYLNVSDSSRHILDMESIWNSTVQLCDLQEACNGHRSQRTFTDNHTWSDST